MKIIEENEIIKVCGENFNVSFDKGVLCRYEKDNQALISKPMKLNFYRAPIDNDGIFNLFPRRITEWNSSLLKYFEFFPQSVEVTEEEDCILVSVMGKALPESCFVGFNVNIRYRIYSDGLLMMNLWSRNTTRHIKIFL